MPHYHNPRNRYRHRRRWRRRRGTSAGAWLIGFLIVLALLNQGHSPEQLRPQGLRSPDTRPSMPPQTPPPLPPIETAGEAAAPDKTSTLASPPEFEASGSGDDKPVDLAPTAPAPAGCGSHACRQAYAGYAAATAHRAFIVSGDGHGFWEADDASMSEAIRRALERCAAGGVNDCHVAHIAGPES